jgi:hypothetical protein
VGEGVELAEKPPGHPIPDIQPGELETIIHEQSTNRSRRM